MRKIILFIILCLPSAGPVSASEAFFPLCWYGVRSGRDIESIKKAGYNCFCTPEKDPEKLSELAVKAGKDKMLMVASPYEVMKSTFSEQSKDWPVLAWTVYGEDESEKLSAEKLEKSEKEIKKWDKRPEAILYGNGEEAMKYAPRYGDYTMLAWFPVPQLRMSTLGLNLAQASAASSLDRQRPGKKTLAVLQAFDWNAVPGIKKTETGHFPDFQELRTMSYLALTRGARGILFYTLASPDGPLYENPVKWDCFEQIAYEINSVSEYFAAGSLKRAGLTGNNEISENILKSKGRKFLIIINLTEKEQKIQLDVLKRWRPLFESSRYPDSIFKSAGGLFYLPPDRTLILEKRKF